VLEKHDRFQFFLLLGVEHFSEYILRLCSFGSRYRINCLFERHRAPLKLDVLIFLGKGQKLAVIGVDKADKALISLIFLLTGATHTELL